MESRNVVVCDNGTGVSPPRSLYPPSLSAPFPSQIRFPTCSFMLRISGRISPPPVLPPLIRPPAGCPVGGQVLEGSRNSGISPAAAGWGIGTETRCWGAWVAVGRWFKCVGEGGRPIPYRKRCLACLNLFRDAFLGVLPIILLVETADKQNFWLRGRFLPRRTVRSQIMACSNCFQMFRTQAEVAPKLLGF